MEPSEKTELLFDFVYACLGHISSNVRTIGLQVGENNLFVGYFYIWRESEETLNDIDNIVVDFEVMQAVSISFEKRIIVNSSSFSDKLPPTVTPTYRAKEAT